MGLAVVQLKALVTSHAAFGYLAPALRLRAARHQRGSPPRPSPARQDSRRSPTSCATDGVTTIYQETLVEPHFAQTVADSTGAKVATLDPLEGITDASAGKDYFEVMRSNLATLQQGQDCS